MTFEDFERLTVEDLRARGGSKWVAYPEAIGSFIAESDFGTAPAVQAAVEARVRDSAFGYSTKGEKDEAAAALERWARDRYGWELESAQIGILPEVLTSLELTLEHFSRPGSAVVVPTPAYMPFFTLLRDHGREIVETPLLREADGWEFDYAAIERAFAAGAGLLVLVNPANPTGAVFSREQLLPLVEIVDRYGGRVWADEIHAPIVYDGRGFAPYASLSETAAAHTVTATSASKGWNIPGLKCSQIVLTNPEDAKAWRRAGRWPSHTTGYLGVFATIAAYDEGREWLDGLVAHLQGSRDLLGELVADRLPRAGYVPPQGTYLGLLDLREYGVQGDLQQFFLREAGVAATDGRQCGRDFRGFLRLNFATPRAVLEETVDRIARALPA
ncbi:MalY/PatB family protein [Gulosibacter sp. 10]|uniref:MalY/PatB family protein n=1 Tax=Gulosibacter sp. 10 TaxID=1255570 RepID=UPI00097E79BD|nr:aminotransferase class I/II-fold pyridoxal phosphate-dependent enzyme [Gulosibacter sp. 10]SJM61741.1 Cystathionine beta-lyase, type II [Gulosibacter sp. 10]